MPVTESAAPTRMVIGVRVPTTQGTVAIDLAPAGGGTLLKYSASVTLTGALAAADNPIVRGLASQQVDHVFARLAQHLG
jgi:carbon monoxide dehydrogenase subunit G